MTVLTEARERFLLAIAAQVPAERIAEIHFFQPIRQGGVESGVAVVAVWPDIPAPAEKSAPAAESEQVERVEQVEDAVDGEQVADADNVEHPDNPEQLERAELLPDDVDESLNVDAKPDAPLADTRPTIYTASYRLTLKGPDRGKWEVHVVAEADAPLVTLEVVVRGVQRRAGDMDDATRIEGDDVRALLRSRAPTV